LQALRLPELRFPRLPVRIGPILPLPRVARFSLPEEDEEDEEDKEGEKGESEEGGNRETTKEDKRKDERNKRKTENQTKV
jgi:hypothetical protein